MPTPAWRRLVPLAVIGLLLAAGLAAWLPGAIRAGKLRSACGRMLQSVADGDLGKAVAAVDPAQQAAVKALFDQYVPADYAQSIASLKLTRSGLEGAAGWTEVLCRFEGAASGIYLGRLRWEYSGGNWRWDFLGSSGAEFSLTDPQWQSLRDLLPDAGRL